MSVRRETEFRLPDRGPWTVALGERQSFVDHRETVVLAPPGTPVARGFETLRRLADRGTKRLRLIGHGVTAERYRNERPATRGEQTILLTELDAYLPSDRAPLLRVADEALREWLASSLAGALDDLAADRVFWGSAMRRIFAPTFYAHPLVHGLAARHHRDTIHCISSQWEGAATLRRALRAGGGEFHEPPVGRSFIPWPVKLSAATATALLAAFAIRTREYIREAPSRRHMDRQRAAGAFRGEPEVWLGLFAAWPESCRHALQAVGSAAGARGQKVGILLHESLASPDRNAPLAGLSHPSLRDRVAAVEQVVAAENLAELLRGYGATARAAARFARRISASGPTADLGSFTVDLRHQINQLARLATIDVLRAKEAQIATDKLVRQRSFRGRRIVWPHASVANVVVPDLLLQRAGATTYDLLHGALAEPLDFVTHARTNSTCSLWWTIAEASYVQPYIRDQHAVGGFLPRSVIPPRRRHVSGPLRVLIVSNYATPTLSLRLAFSREGYQDVLLDAAVHACSDHDVRIRWRPHPFDDQDRVQRSLARWPGKMTLSTQADTLHDEFANADIVISSISSSIVEALVHPVALFVHDIPLHERDVLMTLFPRGRLFSSAEQLATNLSDFARLRAAGDPTRFAPEDALRRAFFGSTLEPRDLGELLWSSDCDTYTLSAGHVPNYEQS